jgi:hypothetical protein
VRLFQRSSESGEDCPGGVLEPRWGNLLPGKPGFPTWSAVMRKSCSEKSRAKAHPDGRYFKKSENGLKIKNKLIRKTLLFVFTICWPPQSREVIPLNFYIKNEAALLSRKTLSV